MWAQEVESLEAAVKELKQKAQQASALAEQSAAQREAAAQEVTKLEALAAELKEQLQKAGSAQVPFFLGLAAVCLATLQRDMQSGPLNVSGKVILRTWTSECGLFVSCTYAPLR